MLMKDRIALANWKGETLQNVEPFSQFGILQNERFTQRAKRTFRILHQWSCERYSSAAQDRFYDLHGRAGLDRRIARVQRLAKAIFI
jgi:hypothetical protein